MLRSDDGIAPPISNPPFFPCKDGLWHLSLQQSPVLPPSVPGDPLWSHLRTGLPIPKSPQSMFAAGSKPTYPAPSPSSKLPRSPVPLGIVAPWRWQQCPPETFIQVVTHTVWWPWEWSWHSQSLNVSHAGDLKAACPWLDVPRSSWGVGVPHPWCRGLGSAAEQELHGQGCGAREIWSSDMRIP